MGEKGLLFASVEARGDAPYSGDATRPCSGGDDWYGAKSIAARSVAQRIPGDARVSPGMLLLQQMRSLALARQKQQ